jgi:hypothetical protein
VALPHELQLHGGVPARITKAIGEVKKAILKGSARDTPVRQPATSHG